MARRMVAPLVALVAAAFLLAPGLVAGPSLDAAVFTIAGRGVLGGAVPYLDIWDHKPPGVYALSAAAQLLTPGLDPWIAVWILSAVWLATSALLVRSIARAGGTGGASTPAAALAIAGMGLFPLSLGGGMTETLALPWALAGLRLGLSAGRGGLRTVIVGVLIGLGTVVSPQVLPAGLALVVVWLRQEGAMAALRRAGLAAAGGALVLAATLAVLATAGALDAALDQIVGYNLAYVDLSRARWPAAFVAAGLVDIFLTLLTMAVLPLVALLPPPAGPPSATSDLRPPYGWLPWVAWLVGGAALMVLQGRAEAHYAVPLAVPLGMLAAPGLVRLTRPATLAGRSRAVAAALIGLALAMNVLYVTTVTTLALEGRGYNSRIAATAVAESLRRLAPDGRIFVWGNGPGIYLRASRLPAGRYTYAFPLTTPGYSSEVQVAELIADLAANPPAAIVDAGSPGPGLPGIVPLLVPRPIETYDGRDLDVAGPLRLFVAERYVLAGEVEGWLIYLPR